MIVISVQSHVELRLLAMRACQAYLEKPVLPAELVGELRRLLGDDRAPAGIVGWAIAGRARPRSTAADLVAVRADS